MFEKREKVWCLPKGVIEKGSRLKKLPYFKTVHFYLLKHVGGTPSNQDVEVDDVRWFKVSEAIRVLAYAQEREILKKAKKMLKRTRLFC